MDRAEGFVGLPLEAKEAQPSQAGDSQLPEVAMETGGRQLRGSREQGRRSGSSWVCSAQGSGASRGTGANLR